MRTFLVLVLALSACSRASSSSSSQKSAQKSAAAPVAAANKVGAPISAAAPVVALADVMKNPDAYKGKSFVTTGTVTAVCQEMGCWMEIKDATGEAHIKMAGEKFYVPKTSAGHKARVQGTLVDVDGGDADCAQEAANQTGKQVAKVQLEATGVELD
jgi:Domain of unknown function (DUF4920)